MTDSQALQILQEIAATQQAIAFSVDRLATAVEKMAFSSSDEGDFTMGFTNNPAPVRIYVARTGKSCWYTLSESGEKVLLKEEAISGTIKRLEIKEIESEEWGDRTKCDLTLLADKTYVIRCGWETAFFKSLVLGLNRMNLQDLKRPITIAAVPGKKESVTLCQIYVSGMAINTTWDEEKEQINWSALFSKAKQMMETGLLNESSLSSVSQENYTPSPLVNNLGSPQQNYSDRLKTAARRAGYSNYELRQIASKVLFREIETGADIETDAECIAVEQALLGNVRGVHDPDSIPY